LVAGVKNEKSWNKRSGKSRLPGVQAVQARGPLISQPTMTFFSLCWELESVCTRSLMSSSSRIRTGRSFAESQDGGDTWVYSGKGLEAAPYLYGLAVHPSNPEDIRVAASQSPQNTTKSKVRAKVEHMFRILKRVFGFDRVRYRGIAKNHHRLCANFALINLYLHRKRLALLGA
jgi:hypothetical protein